jgi:very-short-patch-repair endonuclease/predicted transcriptional regulator of viral defense system
MPNERREMPAMRAELVVRHVGHETAALAARQHGVVARRQLEAMGLSQSAIGRQAAAGRLHRIHRGVYAVGHRRLSLHGHWMAAVLAAGPGAALSHASAAALWEIRSTAATRIDVSTPTAAGRAKRPGLRIHRTTKLTQDEVTEHQAIAVTIPARTLIDLASSLPRRALERALDQAEILELFDLQALERVVDAHQGRRGARILAGALAEHQAGTTVTRSALEEAFLALCAAHALERPQVNVRVCNLEVDFYFASKRLVVEVDGYRYHRTRRAFERDRERDAILAATGHRTLRFTHRQVTRRPREVAAAIRSSA